ncbi:hypothetical protein CPB86DRAFT_819427 [Serendipita vermifera]|nr:hypothetical protein CPB86DRAFT_819427 [Serendipita vermifera]
MDKTRSVILEGDQIKNYNAFPQVERFEEAVPLTKEEADPYQRHPLVDVEKKHFLTTKAIFSTGLELISLITAIIFGIWAIRSYDAAVKANQMSEEGIKQNTLALKQSLIANQLALLALCTSSDEIGNSTTCREVQRTISIPSIASALGVAGVPTSTSSQSSGPSSGSHGVILDPLKILFVVSMAITGILIVAVLCSVFLNWRRSRRKSH